MNRSTATGSVVPTVAVSAALAALTVAGHLPELLVGIIAVALILREGRRGTVERGLLIASIGFLPILVAMEQRGSSAQPSIQPSTGRELLWWGLALSVGAFASARAAARTP